MRWLEHLQRGYIEVGMVRYGLMHMIGSSFDLIIPESGRYPALTARIAVEFTSHCVSFGPKLGEKLDFEVLGNDCLIRDHRNIARAFSFDRYRWSLQLPDLVQRLSEHMCYFTGQGNWLIIRGIDDQGHFVDYEIYFRLRRRAPSMLRLVIESAYVRDLDRPKPGLPTSRKGRVRFRVMVAKVLRGEPLSDPSHNRY